MFGYFSWKDLIISGIQPVAMLVNAPTRIRPLCSPCSSPTAKFRSSCPLTMDWIIGRSCDPSELISMPERLRVSSGTFHASSRSAIMRLTADCV